MKPSYRWQIKTFDQLNTTELYDILKLRIDVFVVEQTCFYPDLDDLDRADGVLHQFAYADDNQLVGYCRILPPKVVYDDECAIGRVIIAPPFRGKNLAVELMYEALAACDKHWPSVACHISAQQHLTRFYESLGFAITTPMYLEDDIPHVGMVRAAS